MCKVLGLIPVPPALNKKATLRDKKDNSKTEKTSANYISNKVYISRNTENSQLSKKMNNSIFKNRQEI